MQASCTKNKKQAVQPLPLDVAEACANICATSLAGKPFGRADGSRERFLMIQGDLKQARRHGLQAFQDARQRAEAEQSDFLAYCDSQGRYADFHALRHTYITMVGKTGVSPREHQDLARHSTYALTSRYTHSRFYDLAAAVQGLPIPTSGTGNHNHGRHGDGGTAKKSLAHSLAHNRLFWAIFRDKLRQMTRPGHNEKTPEKSRFLRLFRGLV